ncbi:hypothetical protein F511_06591 [Dorcoceras hygrometricum]|uniref:Dystroglycan-like n=1 Tax=Dorcoceras hygrometricum TaxID=472368 RepID=A0A2Z7BB08_9LAMI|nr:hypothetical protein F511_06591 [Dorcoceras hygrometricum]
MAASLYSNSVHVDFESALAMGEPGIISNHLLLAMAASLYSNSVHIDFESVLAMGEPGMVSMFQALVASGLQGFLGCSAVVYEEALVEFFANGTVRDGLVVSTVNGVVLEISEKLFAETFDLPVDGLAKVSEMPKDKIFDARSIVSMTGEPVILSGSKNQMKMHYRLLCDIMAKSISVKAGSFNVITVEKFSLLTAVVYDVRMNWGSVLFGIFKKMVSPGTKQAKGFAIQISLLLEMLKKKRTSKRILTLETVVVAQEAIPIQSVPVSPAVDPMVEDQQEEFCQEQSADEIPADKSAASTEERHWFDLSYEELIAQWAAERPNVEPDEEAATMDVVTAGEDQQVQESVAQISNDDLLDDDEQKSLEDILLVISVDVPLPSAGMEITKIVMGQEIKIPGITEKTWFLSSLPKIPADHKGKAILVEKDPIKGNPAQEHYFLICADIDLLVALRAKVIDEVALFFNSFILKKLATINIEEMYKKEELVLSWGETESPQVAIQRKLYILLKYRKVLVWKFLESWRSNFVPGQGSSAVDRRVIELLSDLHVSILEELTKAARAHGIIWKKACCSAMFEGSSRDRGAVIARTNTNTRSSCWIRTMIFVDGVWTVEPCADRWVKIPRQEVQEVNAKVDIMASRLNDVQKDAEATKEALSHQLFEFQSQAQENQNILHAQLSEIVDYIHRGSADKKGESGSRGLQ